MPNTPALSLPYPPPTGVAPDVPYYLQQLAEAVEAVITDAGSQKPIASGVQTFEFTADATIAETITFPVGRFSVAPIVVAVPNSGAGAATGLSCRVTIITASSCEIYADATSSITANIPIGWIAREAG
jgi:hypothetical protein